jgi:hypothetical protein
LFDCQGGGDLLEGALAFSLAEEVEAKGGDALADQHAGEGIVRRTGFRRKKSVTQDGDLIGSSIGGGQNSGHPMTVRIEK